MPMLHVKDISVAYDTQVVLQGISLSAARGQHISIMGESGSGKSTLLKAIYGLLRLQSGELFWDDQPLLGPDYHLVPGEDFIKYVAQDFDLMPFVTVEENIAKFLSRFHPAESSARTQELVELMGLQEVAKQKAQFLSGGQKQRVALARALAKEPSILLLDEPFGQIDNSKRNLLRRKLFQYLKERDITCLVATHDAADALSYAHQVIILKNGSIVAKANPNLLYQNPNDRYVASLFGDVNVLPRKWFDEHTDSDKDILLYPHEIHVGEGEGVLAEVTQSYYLGTHYLTEAMVKGSAVLFNHKNSLFKGSEVVLSISKKLLKHR